MERLLPRTLFAVLFGAVVLACNQDAADLLFDKKIVAPVIPKVINVTATNANGTFATGSPIHIQVVFNTTVTVTGTPQLTLSTGNPTVTNINYVSGTGTNTLMFDYTVIATNTSADLDYASANSLILNSGTIVGTNGITAVLTLPAPGTAGSLGANKDLVIDPNAAQITAVDSTTANGTYISGQSIVVRVTYNAAVTVNTGGGTPRIPMDVVTANTYANYTSGSGTTVLIFTYVVATGNSSADLNYPSGAAIDLNGGTIVKTSNATAADLTLRAHGSGSLGDNQNIVIDAIVPVITNTTSSTANGSYKAGDAVSIQVTFSKNMSVNTGGGTPTLSLNSGGTATYTSVSTNTLTFSYTVAGGNSSADLDVNTLNLNGGTIADSLGNSASTTITGTTLGTNKNIIIDTTAPTISNITSSTANGSYKAGGVVSIQVVFSESITVSNASATLSLNSGAGVTASYVNLTGSNTLNFTYTIAATQNTTDLSVSLFNTATAVIADTAGNVATLTLPAGNNLADNKDIVIDTTAPTVSYVTTINAPNTHYNNPTINVQVVFSEPVFVTGTPRIQLDLLTLILIPADEFFDYTSTSGNILRFDCFISGKTQATTYLDYTSTGALQQNGGSTIKDAAGNDATLTLPATGSGTSLASRQITVN